MAASRKRHAAEHDEEPENGERWLLTYADMITLLMVLFIVMFAISQVDKQKFAALADGLRHNLGGSPQVVTGGSGILDGGKTVNKDDGKLDADPSAPIPDISKSDPASKTAEAAAQRAKLQEAKKEIEAALKAKGLQSSVRFEVTERGLVVSIVTDEVLFDTARAELKPQGRTIIDAIAPALRKLPNNISIEGHTDNRPISTSQFPTNWELSVIRATTVLRYLESDGISGKRMSATGYGDERPVAPNATADGRSLNRRVALVVMSSAVSPTSQSVSITTSTRS